MRPPPRLATVSAACIRFILALLSSGGRVAAQRLAGLSGWWRHAAGAVLVVH